MTTPQDKIHPSIPKVPRLPINLPESQVERFQSGWRSAVLTIQRTYWKRMGDPLTDIDETRMLNLLNRYL